MPTLTIIETGQAPETIRDDWPDYPTMFCELLEPHLEGWNYVSLRLSQGEALPDPADLDAILITGSPAGVYDDTGWMSPLMDFIRWAAAAQTPQIGICFGHQAIAHALGAQVGKSDKGWGIGRHVYDVVSPQSWMGQPAPATFGLGVSHQDQVQSLAPGAELVARSDFCEFAALAYPTAKAISFQGHPEFSPDFNCALYGVRKGGALAVDSVEAAEKSFETPVDNDQVGQWMATFLKDAIA
ncbi:MAG: type 1 glutamine amidotransferase [Pseudomonadota bacterium]